MRKSVKYIIIFISVFIVFLFLNNTSMLCVVEQRKPLLLAHRGLAQTFGMAGITNDTDTSKRIFPPEHPYIENTIASMEAAFKAGADIVEADIQRTRNDKFAVFHDHALEFRTDASGPVRNFTMEELKKLDVGYGYTADGGKTFPFRGKGAGLMPSLDEVLARFPDGDFLLHIKSDDSSEGQLAAKFLGGLSEQRLKKITVYGGDQPISRLKEKLPGLRVMSKKTLMKSLLDYEMIGWSGYVPASCRGAWLHIPLKYAPMLWGWPHKFMKRMDGAGAKVVIVAGDGKFSEGFDSPEDFKNIPPGFSGYIWTNRIDRAAAELNK